MTTKAENQHLSRVAELACVVCRNEGLGETPASCHHIRDGQGMSQRASHWEVIPICHHHHQGAEGIHTLGTKTWQARYGAERDLLAQIRMELGIE